MKYYYYIRQDKKEEITSNLVIEATIDCLKNNPLSIVTPMHVVTSFIKKYKPVLIGCVPVRYTYEEGLEILKSLNINHEYETKLQLKRLIGKDPETHHKLPCDNCGHPIFWHFDHRKCCDGKCDCDSYKYVD